MHLLKRFVPRLFSRVYHFSLALLGAILYRFPSRHLRVIAVTGTKGKTSVTELVAAMLEASGEKVAVSNTVRFKIGDRSDANLYKMTMPGRFFLQSFLRRAVKSGCQFAIIEMTSEGTVQFRHRFIALTALIFTNLAPEHIESHGSFEKYRAAKLSIARALARSPQKERIMVVNGDDRAAPLFLSTAEGCREISFALVDAEPYRVGAEETSLTLWGESVTTPLRGIFNISNILAAAFLADALSVPRTVIRTAISTFAGIPGRLEEVRAGQPFSAIVDYAHTSDSLREVYSFLKKTSGRESALICVLGSTGGGRDKWKRPEMGAVAARYCDRIILTNEDPYDEDPEKIIDGVAEGVLGHPRYRAHHPHTGERHAPEPRNLPDAHYARILDRRDAIRHALRSAREGDTVVITGKGTDPYIMGPNASKEPWSDATVAREELAALGYRTGS